MSEPWIVLIIIALCTLMIAAVVGWVITALQNAELRHELYVVNSRFGLEHRAHGRHKAQHD